MATKTWEMGVEKSYMERMIAKNKVVAIIPARAGSKRLIGKNTKDFHGKPLIRWTIEAAEKSKLIDKVIVSTDCNEILNYSYGNKTTCIKRDAKLADDNATSVDVALSVLEYINEFEIIVWLQPTSPLRDFNDIDKLVKIFIEKSVNTLTTAHKVSHPMEWVGRIEHGKFKALLNNEVCNKSQDAKKYYQINGFIYIINKLFFEENKLFINEETHFEIIEEEKSIDIDTIIDFKLAEFFFERNTNKKISCE